MSSELNILALYGVLIVVVIFAQVVVTLAENPLGYLASARDEAAAPSVLGGAVLAQ